MREDLRVLPWALAMLLALLWSLLPAVNRYWSAKGDTFAWGQEFGKKE